MDFDLVGCRAAQLLDDWHRNDVEAIVAKLADDVELRARHPRGMPGRRRFQLTGKVAVAEQLRSAIGRFFGYELERSHDEGDSLAFNLKAEGLVTVLIRCDDQDRIVLIESYRTSLNSPMLSTRSVPRAG